MSIDFFNQDGTPLCHVVCCVDIATVIIRDRYLCNWHQKDVGAIGIFKTDSYEQIRDRVTRMVKDYRQRNDLLKRLQKEELRISQTLTNPQKQTHCFVGRLSPIVTYIPAGNEFIPIVTYIPHISLPTFFTPPLSSQITMEASRSCVVHSCSRQAKDLAYGDMCQFHHDTLKSVQKKLANPTSLEQELYLRRTEYYIRPDPQLEQYLARLEQRVYLDKLAKSLLRDIILT